MQRPETDYDYRLLRAIAQGSRVTQRALSNELGVALGLTNLLIRRLVGKGYVRMTGMGTRHIRYLMTPAGWEALARTTRVSLENTVNLYTQTREHIRLTLADVSSRCEADANGQKRVVFYGAGDVAEIAYVSLQGTGLTLSGVVDDRRRGRFFDVTICGPDQLTASTLNGTPFSHVIVASIRHADAILQRISDRGVPRSRVSCI
jgi:DNA-binding MarR family transcriptional regulator